MPYIRDSFWKGREFTSLTHMRADAVRWSLETAGRRQCRPLEGAAPAAVFEAVERDKLRPLPGSPFELAIWSRGKVSPNIHLKVGQCIYSLPWKYIGKTIDARSTHDSVEFFHQGELIKTHVRKPKGKQTDFIDYPPEKVAFFMKTPVWCRKKAAEVGPACEQVIEELLSGEQGLGRLRSAQWILGLADRTADRTAGREDAVGTARLEDACRRALAAGDLSYQTIKAILASTADRPLPDQEPAPSRARRQGGGTGYLRGPQAFASSAPATADTGPSREPGTGTVVAFRPRTRAS